MSDFKLDLRDVEFNLFELLNVQNNELGLEEQDLKGILSEFTKFVENEVIPTRVEGDEVGVKLENGQVIVPKCFQNLKQGMYENGWFAIGVPEEFGGVPVPGAVESACTSLVNSGNLSFAMYSGLSKGCLNVIRSVGTKEQKTRYIEKMMSGEWGGTMCLTESGAGSDVGALRTSATPMGDGKYKIKGEKIFISSGDNDLYDNIVHLVLAKTPNAPEGTKGISLFIVPKFKQNGESNDVRCAKIEEKMGIHGSATCVLNFGGSDNCEGELIGKEFEGMANMFIMMNEERHMVAIQGESQAHAAFQLATKYASERAQFGTEIVNHPDVKRMLLKLRALSRGLKSLCFYHGSLFDDKSPEGQAEVELLTPIVKNMGSDKGFLCASDAVQIHGGYGFCTEYGVEQLVRDTKITAIYEGTNGIQAIDFVTRKVLKDGGKTLMSHVGKIKETVGSPAAGEWKAEQELFTEVLTKLNDILKRFQSLAEKKDFNAILQDATSFTDFCGHVSMAWLQLRSAIIAKEKLKSAAGDDEKAYYESKIVDYRTFVKYVLTENLGIHRNICGFTENIDQYRI